MLKTLLKYVLILFVLIFLYIICIYYHFFKDIISANFYLIIIMTEDYTSISNDTF